MQLVKWRECEERGLPKSGLIIISGRVKTGKSRFAASFPDSYVIMAERNGGKRIPGRIHPVSSLQEFADVLSAIEKEKSIKCIVIDTLDAVGNWIAQAVAKKHGLENIDEKKKGIDKFAVWGSFHHAMTRIIDRLLDTDKLIVIPCHHREPKTDTDGTIISPARIALPGKSGDYALYHALAVGATYREGKKYYLTFEGGPLAEWGSRLDEVASKTIELPKENPYKAFEGLFKTNGKGG